MAGTATTELSVPTPPYHVPESILFAYPTRLSASWEVRPEKIIKDSLDVDRGEIRIQVKEETTQERCGRSKNPLRWVRGHSNLRLPDKLVFDGRFETDKNIAHVMREVVARVLLARKSLAPVLGFEPEIHVILRAGASRMSQEIHRIIGIPVILSDARVDARIVRVVRSCVPTRLGGRVLHTSSLSIVALFPEIFREIELGPTVSDLPEKVFISRRSTRALQNEKEVWQLLEGRGFRKYYFEDVPVAEQLQVVANARQVVAIHGAALGAIVFNKRGVAPVAEGRGGVQLIELFGPGYLVDYYRHCAAVMNARWCAVRGKITSEVLRDLDERGLSRAHEKSPFAIDPETLEMALEYSASRASANS
jgi:hypothetical protein